MGERYTLPAALGGGEVELLERYDGPGPHVGLVGSPAAKVFVASLGTAMVVPSEWLTPVKPPPPIKLRVVVDNEPAPGSLDRPTQRIRVLGADGITYAETWLDLRLGQRAVAAVDPFDEPVELPWVVHDPDGDSIEVRQSPVGATVGIGDDAAVGLRAAQCRDLARALWTAANRADGHSDG